MQRCDVRPFVCLSGRHTHRDSPGHIMRRRQRTFRPDMKKIRHICYSRWSIRNMYSTGQVLTDLSEVS